MDVASGRSEECLSDTSWIRTYKGIGLSAQFCCRRNRWWTTLQQIGEVDSKGRDLGKITTAKDSLRRHFQFF